MEPLKRKKPPACDHCKMKRVLCHPSPNGCPRCLEKGIVCTTTPVVRRKAQKKTVHSALSCSATPEASTSAGLSFPSALVASSACSTPLPNILPPTPPDGLVYPTDFNNAFATTGSSSALPSITPELAQNLFLSFQQSSNYDHPLLRMVDLPAILNYAASAVSGSPSSPLPLPLLPPQQRTLLYTILSLGALLSFHPAIVGQSPFLARSSLAPASAPAPHPSSFSQLNEAILSAQRSGHAPDLRDFGRRRSQVCSAMRAEAERLAKESDTAFEATVENAASCVLLDALAGVELSASPIALNSVASSRPRPWLAAHISHLRVLADDASLQIPHGEQGNARFDPEMWAPFFASEVMCDAVDARMTTKDTDHFTFTGSEIPDAAKFDKELKLIALGPVDERQWPDLNSFGRIYLATARKLHTDFLATSARRAPLDDTALSSFLASLNLLRSITTTSIGILTRLDALYEPSAETTWYFPHAIPRKLRYDGAMGRQGFQDFANFSWTSLVLPMYRELQRREAIAAVSSMQSLEGEDDFEARAARDRLRLSVSQVRELLFLAMKARSATAQYNPHALRRMGYMDWAEALLEEIEAGRWFKTEKVIEVVERFSSVLKLVGYAHAGPRLDEIINRLDQHVLDYRLSSSLAPVLPAPPVPCASTLSSYTPFPDQPALTQTPFDSNSFTLPAMLSPPKSAAPPLTISKHFTAQPNESQAELAAPIPTAGGEAAAFNLDHQQDVSAMLGLTDWTVW
ncbi:hypothetical protein JCM11251_001447 [Rhodosporidiobolus azoricus]